MIIALFVLSGAALASSEAEAFYEPYRQCMTESVAEVFDPEQSDEQILDAARSQCMDENLYAGTNAIFKEIAVTGSQETAIDNLSNYRAEIETEALEAARQTLNVIDHD
ncbi:MAG: hypothetical protein ABR601_00360 [Parasphingopyxis sp.]|nr:hypothetical protein [Sphingomonadales bacterium]